MTRAQKILFVVLFVGGILGFIFWQWSIQRSATSATPIVTTATTSEVSAQSSESSPAQDPANGLRFVDNRTRFSFPLPEGFTAQEYPYGDEPDSIAVIVQDSGDNGVEILVRPLSKNASAFSEDSVRATHPNETMTNFRAITAEGVPALSFDSTSALWDGASHEVWFVKDGYLYQISSYARDASLVDAVAATWRWGDWFGEHAILYIRYARYDYFGSEPILLRLRA